jgi:hypothetical protein
MANRGSHRKSRYEFYTDRKADQFGEKLKAGFIFLAIVCAVAAIVELFS